MKIVTFMAVTSTLALVLLSACTKTEKSLVGTYHLVNASNCRADVEDSHLVIHSDGTYDERAHFKNIGHEATENGHWTYDRKARRISFSKFLISSETSFEIEPGHPAVIFVSRARNCWYGQPK